MNNTEMIQPADNMQKTGKSSDNSMNSVSRFFKNRLTVTIIISIIILVFSGIGGIAILHSIPLLPPSVVEKLFSGGSTTLVIAPPNFNPKPIDKLFTTFVYMPILDYKYNYNGTDLVGMFFDDVSKKVLKGYCVRQYEVGIGYDSVKDLFPQYQEFACRGEFQKMPAPQIIASNPIKTDTQGEYTLSECTSWDVVDSSGQRKSHKQIYDELKQNGQWKIMIENSQKMLMGYMRVYCQNQ